LRICLELSFSDMKRSSMTLFRVGGAWAMGDESTISRRGKTASAARSPAGAENHQSLGVRSCNSGDPVSEPHILSFS